MMGRWECRLLGCSVNWVRGNDPVVEVRKAHCIRCGARFFDDPRYITSRESLIGLIVGLFEGLFGK